VTNPALDRALTGSGLRPLPAVASELLVLLDTPPRLGAHLRVVHDVAWSLTDRLGRARPDLDFDTTAVLFGAATHDIGKTIHREELTQPGDRHKAAGRDLLVSYGVPWHLARFASTHGSWESPEMGLEDLLVSVADQVCKGARVPGLEDRVAGQLGGLPLFLDDLLRDLAAGASGRLAFQASFAI
jgi:hypothetical protein